MFLEAKIHSSFLYHACLHMYSLKVELDSESKNKLGLSFWYIEHSIRSQDANIEEKKLLWNFKLANKKAFLF